MICLTKYLPVLGVTHGHLGGPAGVAVGSPLHEPSSTGTTTGVAAPPAGTTTLPEAFLDVAGRAEGGPAEPAALRRGAPTGGPGARRRPIRPVDARLQKDSVDASDAHETLSEDDGCT